MKKSILFSLIFIFIVGCGSSSTTNENSYQEINYTSFDGNISSLIPPSLPSES